MKDHIALYLQNYAEPEAKIVRSLKVASFQAAAVIPSFDEDGRYLDKLLQNTLWQSYILILVINRPSTIASCQRNIDLMQKLYRHYPLEWRQHNISYLHNTSGCDILLVDREQSAIATNYGVGLARKIGCDVALQLYAQSQIKSRWLYSSDMDVQLPTCYFDSVEQHKPSSVALLYRYRHMPSGNKKLDNAMQHYQSYMDHYRDQLAQLGSPYAWTALGSILAFTMLDYAKIRGFPKRSAGEDFYLLNKLSKIGRVGHLEHCELLIDTRLSTRVPFGTGTRLQQLLQGGSLPDHSSGFTRLGQWFAQWQLLAEGAAITDLALEQAVRQYVLDAGAQMWLQQARQVAKNDVKLYINSLHRSFDAIKTLQFIRHFS